MHTNSRNNLHELGLLVLPGFIPHEVLALCRNYLQAVKERYAKKLGEESDYIENDKHHPNTFSFYSPLCTEVLLLKLLPEIERLTGVDLVPSYSYARTYYNGSFLEKHTDRKCSQFGVSICLDRDVPDWPLIIIDRTVQAQSVELDRGDAVLFFGMQLEHYRDKFCGSAQTQLFLFYVEKNESNSQFYFDRRPTLGSSFLK